MSAGTVEAVWRYPVKSMLGERLDAAEVGHRGLAGDRAYAVVDAVDGTVASAKHPGKWGRLLHVQARYEHEPAGSGDDDDGAPPVTLIFPDGTEVRGAGGEPDADGVLSEFLGRPVRLVSQPPEGGMFEEVWPTDIEGLAPAAVIEKTTTATTDDGEPVSRFPVAMDSPPGRFFDVASLHVLTTAALAALRKAAPGADFDVRRYRPNFVLDIDGDGFLENDWVGRTLAIGPSCRARVDLPTMRCVMTTLGQAGLEPDRSTLRAVAQANRIELSIGGMWACAGAYAGIVSGGRVRVGDTVDIG